MKLFGIAANLTRWLDERNLPTPVVRLTFPNAPSAYKALACMELDRGVFPVRFGGFRYGGIDWVIATLPPADPVLPPWGNWDDTLVRA